MTTTAKDTDHRRIASVRPANVADLVAALMIERHGTQRELEHERFANLTTERAA